MRNSRKSGKLANWTKSVMNMGGTRNGCSITLGRAAWIPHGPDLRSAFAVGQDIEEPNASGLGRHGCEAQRHADKYRQ